MKFGMQFNIKLKNQIILGYLILLVLIIFLIMSMIYSLRSLDHSSARILKENYISIKSGQSMNSALLMMNEITVLQLKVKDDSSTSQKFDDQKKLFQQNYDIVHNNITELGERELVKRIHQEFIGYISAYDHFIGTDYPINLYLESLLPKYSRLQCEIATLVDLNHQASLIKDEKSKEDFNLAWIYLIIISGITIIVAYLTIAKIPPAILKPLNQVTEEISSIAEGNYGHTIDIKSKNELGALIDAFNVMSKKLEAYKKSSMSIIIAQKSRMESIVNSLNDAIIILDENKKFVLVNPKALQLLGIKGDQLVEKNAYEVSLYNNLLRELLRMLDPGDESESNKYLRISINGREEYYSREFIKVTDVESSDSEKLLGYVIELKNITAFKELDDTKSTFIATLSHEVKTPLSAMNMSLNLLLNKKMGILNNEQENIAITMKNEVQRLLAIVTDLLDLSKFETGHIKIHFQSVEAKFLLNYSLSPFYNEIKEKDISLVTQIAADLPVFKADPEKISWVLMNLISNAIRYTPKNEQLSIEVQSIDNDIQFCITDSGPGIEEKYLSRIFEKYFQVPGKEYENQDGLGLGLAICKEIVLSHRGKIWVTSQEGVGSKFYFTLPTVSI